MSKAAVKISGDLLSNPLCEQDQAFLESMTALDTAMKRMDAFNQEKVRLTLPLGWKYNLLKHLEEVIKELQNYYFSVFLLLCLLVY